MLPQPTGTSRKMPAREYPSQLGELLEGLFPLILASTRHTRWLPSLQRRERRRPTWASAYVAQGQGPPLMLLMQSQESFGLSSAHAELASSGCRKFTTWSGAACNST